jgi:hypothetical protein
VSGTAVNSTILGRERFLEILAKEIMRWRTSLSEQEVVLENVANSTHLTKNQDTRTLFFHAWEY